MSGTPRPHDPDRLAQALALLAEDVVFPETPAFDHVFATLPRREPAPVAPRAFPGRAWAIGLAAAVLLLLSLAIPMTRETVSSWFGFPGIRIEIGDDEGDPPPTVTTIGDTLLLGSPVPLGEASEQAGFTVLVPASPPVAGAPEAWLKEYGGVPVVTLLYPATDDLPAIGATGVGLLLMEIDAGGDTGMMMVKRAAVERPPISVRVNGHDGLWVEGGVLVTDAGDPFGAFQRRSGNVLVWEQGGITYRLESNLPLIDAIAIAESLVPVGD